MRTALALVMFVGSLLAADQAQPVRTSAALPFYPPLARIANLQGEVVVKVTISPNGKPMEVGLVSGNPLLGKNAVENVQSWTFQPPGGPLRREILFVYQLSPDLATGDFRNERVTFFGARKVIIETDPAPGTHDLSPELRNQ